MQIHQSSVRFSAIAYVLAASGTANAAEPLPRADGYSGCWYMNQETKDEYKYKYSGGMATYPQQHAPIAIYSNQANKTYFVYGGKNPGNNSILHLVSYYDHATGHVPRPVILLDKKTSDAHDNPTLCIDKTGHLYVFSNAHGTSRPSYIHRSSKPYDISEFKLILETNFSYGSPWLQPSGRILLLHTKYSSGRGLFALHSDDGKKWTEPIPFAHISKGDYQFNFQNGKTLATVFDYHPEPLGLNARTNLYYLQTTDEGKTWTTINGENVRLPLKDVKNPALIRDYEKEKKLVYVKDINYDAAGKPVILFLTSNGAMPGPDNGPYEWHTARWTGSEWVFLPFTTSDHNYDHGSLYIESDGTWRIIAPTVPGPQPFGTGGEMTMWTSGNQGKTWMKVKDLTKNSSRNHTYARRPLNAHPDFYALWADGDARKRSESFLYFTSRSGKVFQLPAKMDAGSATPRAVE